MKKLDIRGIKIKKKEFHTGDFSICKLSKYEDLIIITNKVNCFMNNLDNILVEEYIIDRFVDLYTSSSIKVEKIIKKLNDEILRYSAIGITFSIAVVEIVLSRIKIYFWGNVSAYKGTIDSFSNLLDETNTETNDNYINLFEKDNFFREKFEYYFICTTFEEEIILKRIHRIILENREKSSEEILNIIYKYITKLNLNEDNIVMVLIK